MANTFLLETAKNQGRYLYLTLTQTADISTNTSTINWTLTATGGSSNYYATGATTVIINNTEVYFKKRVPWSDKVFPAAKGSVSGSLKVEHNTDGSLTIPVSLSTAIQVAEISTVSGDWTLDSIPRGANILSAPDFNDEENPTITYENKIGTNVDTLQACITFDGSNADIAYRDISKTGTSYTFNLTDAERKVLRKGVTSGIRRKLKFCIKSVIGENVFYSKSDEKTLTLVNATPSVEPTIIDTNTRAIELTGNPNTIIKGYNSVKVVANATAKKEATIISYNLYNGSKTISTAEGYFDYVENNYFYIQAVDSRGWSITIEKSIPMIDYIKLTCNLSSSIELTGGTNAAITLNISGNYFNDSFGAKSNTLSIKYRYKTKGGSYGDWIDTTDEITYSNGGYQLKEIIPDLDYQKTYIVQAIAYDAVYYGGITSAENTLKAIPVFDWSSSDFNFNVPVSIEGYQLADYVIEQGTSSMGANDTWHWSKWKNGKAECYGVCNLGDMNISTAWGNWFESANNFNKDFPNGLFVDTPEVLHIDVISSNGAAFIERGHGNTPSATNTGYFKICRPTNLSLSQVKVSFHAIGHWKI